jgi:hypothetical protein
VHGNKHGSIERGRNTCRQSPWAAAKDSSVLARRSAWAKTFESRRSCRTENINRAALGAVIEHLHREG